ncbi:glutamate synthase [Agrilactobacillus composti DSM 18527 = JCM 14202]|nr:glutamate synthase [Agrilactobacillus composti DSM 18527 = JCM 14202]
MTGGHVVILGSTGQNFGAGMSGGIAYVYDPEKTFAAKLNPEMVDLLPLEATDQAKLHDMLADHLKYTQSTQAQKILDAFEFAKKDFVKVYPKDFHHINDIIANLEKQSDLPQNQILEKAFEIAVAQD